MEKWSQADKDIWKKRVDETNRAWGEKNEHERRERVAKAFGFEKNKAKINSEASTSKSQNSTSKDNNQSQKM